MLKQTRLINDTIYKHIECSNFEDKILQTKIVNRLLFITQNALAYFAYPSINTKRYIHSLGTMHLSAHMYKNAILNSKEDIKSDFLKNLKKSINNIIKNENLNISLKNIETYSDKSLYEFIIPLKSSNNLGIYLVTLQALRVVALLHDVGHFPFSHQVEYALQRIYSVLKQKDIFTKKEENFITFYETITKNGKLVLHEAIGNKLIKLLFEYELKQFDATAEDKAYMKLIYKIVSNILNEKDDGNFDYKVLHKFIDSTVDADRLDYINRDMLASGYISGAVDFIRITKQAVLIKHNDKFDLSFFDSELIDIEHMLEMRFNLYKKFIYNYKISSTDSLLENVILFLAQNYFIDSEDNINPIDSISMLWNFLDEKNLEKRLDIISQLDENWIITLFKKEYFKIKYKENHSFNDIKYLTSFEEVLFGKKFYYSIWKNLNDLHKILEFTEKQRYKFRESFGFVSPKRYEKLQILLEDFCKRYENVERCIFYSYRIVSLNIGIDKDFYLYDNEKILKIDEVSTLRKRLKKSIQNTVPFYLYSNDTSIDTNIKKEIISILEAVFL